MYVCNKERRDIERASYRKIKTTDSCRDSDTQDGDLTKPKQLNIIDPSYLQFLFSNNLSRVEVFE